MEAFTGVTMRKSRLLGGVFALLSAISLNTNASDKYRVWGDGVLGYSE